MQVLKKHKFKCTKILSDCKDIISAESAIQRDIDKNQYLGITLRKGNKYCGNTTYSTGYSNLEYIVEDV